MKSLLCRHRLTVELCGFALGCVAFLVACGLLVSYAQLFGLKRDTALMIGTTLPEKKAAVALLKANTEAEELFQSESLASREEQAQVYVLPLGSPGPRIADVVSEVVRTIHSTPGATLSLQTLTIGAPVDQGKQKAFSVHIVLRGSFQSVSRLLQILDIGGQMLVRDAISESAREQFLSQVEESAPLSLKGATDFLYLDLLAYAALPDALEEQSLKDIPADILASVRAQLLKAGLAGVRSAFDGIAQDLRDRRIWPLPLLSVQSMTRAGDTWTVGMVGYGR